MRIRFRFFPSDAFAMREMTDYLARPDSHYGKHPEDFSLYRLGTFDDGSGSFELLPEPKFVVALRSLKGGES